MDKRENLIREHDGLIGFAENNFYCMSCRNKSPSCENHCLREGV